MNVLFVQPALPHYRVPFFAELQRRAGFAIEVWSDHEHPLFPFCDPGAAFTAVHHPESQWGPFVSQPAILRAVRDAAADVVVLSWNTRYVELLPGLVLARCLGRPVVLWGHGYSKRYSYWKHRTRNLLGRLARACVTYSEPTRQRLIAEGLSSAATFAAPNALDGAPLAAERQFWQANPDEQQRLRTQLGIGEGRFLLFVSRLEPDKRVDLLLEAFMRAARRQPDVQLVVVGGGSQRQSLQALAQHLDIALKLHWLGPIYDEHVLGGVFCSATAFVYPVAVGLSILHALNYGLPVITSDDAASHNPEFDVLLPGHNSLVYRHDDVDDLAHQIDHLLEDDALRAKLSAGALASVTGPTGRTLANMVDGMNAALRFAASEVQAAG